MCFHVLPQTFLEDELPVTSTHRAFESDFVVNRPDVSIETGSVRVLQITLGTLEGGLVGGDMLLQRLLSFEL